MKNSPYTLLLFLFLGCGLPAKEPTEKVWLESIDEYWRLSEAEEYSKALTIAKEQVGYAEKEFPESAFLAESHERLGNTYKSIHDYQKAAHYLRKSIFLGKSKGFATLSAYQRLSLVYVEAGKIDSALTTLHKAFSENREATGIDSIYWYEAKVNLAEILIMKREYQQAEKLLEAVHVYSTSKGDSSLMMTAATVKVRLDIYNAHYDSALKACEILKGYYKRNNEMERYGSTVNNIGAIYFAKKNYGKAIEYFQKAADQKLTRFKDSAYVATELINISVAYEKNHDTLKSQYYYRLHKRVSK
ncbi:hypothetical protein GU926_12005 [Nibribacter ruber]|uniref:Tetratricopeptide repeat protein n=1 Tax=Nibribacter ruber TaxID=2698458 RepID=A0A6P1NWA5_9BACT|nr:tetratricopeptide repeat protein [Nibribacter ruber]QHL88116.1 hypothetical protein GU926_12005 [Nibribacter ruber]